MRGSEGDGRSPSGASITVAVIIPWIQPCRERLPHFAHIVGSRLGEFGKGWFRRRAIAAAVVQEFPDLALERV